MKTFVLASQSPRRRQLLESIGLKFLVDPPIHFQEAHPANKSAHELVEQNAIGKAKEIAQKHPNAIILGVDTVGAFEDHILEKPKDEDDAFRMLQMLQGTTHQVLTGLCLIDTKTNKTITAIESSDIEFLPLTEKQVRAYIATGEPMDKAAAYGIQGIASIFAKRIEGDFFNVVGLPMARLHLMLKEFDIELMDQLK